MGGPRRPVSRRLWLSDTTGAKGRLQAQPAPGGGNRTVPSVPPRILIVSGDHWPRALLRAELVEAGYDAIGTRDLSGALHYPAVQAGRGPVRLLIVDQVVLEEEENGHTAAAALDRLRSLHPAAAFLLLARGTGAPAPGRWDAVLSRPATIGQVVAKVKELVPSR